jgi:hypothetical protein
MGILRSWISTLRSSPKFAFKELYEVRGQACNTAASRPYEARIHLLGTSVNKGSRTSSVGYMEPLLGSILLWEKGDVYR